MFIAALSKITKGWKQQIIIAKEEKVHMYTHSGILLSHKNNKLLPLPTMWIDLEGIM